MNKDYVSLEVAKLLKEKGFDWYCRNFYDYSEKEVLQTHACISNAYDVYAAPTLYEAKKWLREHKEIHVMIDVCASGYYAMLWETNGTFIKSVIDKGPNDGGVWDTYEEALQVGILEALKLI